MAFPYHPLKHGEIRLLRLLDDSGMRCDIERYELLSAPRYIALSYTWGRSSYQKGRSSDEIYDIIMNHQVLQVQQNMHDALRHLGKEVRKRNCRLWLDFLCINQLDTEERSSQVRLMKDIYERSAAVFAWLGQPFDDRETELAVALMRDFKDSCMMASKPTTTS